MKEAGHMKICLVGFFICCSLSLTDIDTVTDTEVVLVQWFFPPLQFCRDAHGPHWEVRLGGSTGSSPLSSIFKPPFQLQQSFHTYLIYKMDSCVIFHPKAGFCCLKWCICIYELDSSHEMNYYLEELRNLPLAKDTNSVLQRWAGVGVSLIAWPDVSNMLQGKLDFSVPGAELQKLENGVGMRERGKVKHVSVSVCRDLGKHLFWKKGSCRNSDGILLKRTFWAKASFSLLLLPLSQGPKWWAKPSISLPTELVITLPASPALTAEERIIWVWQKMWKQFIFPDFEK